jgi:protein ImuB
MAFASIFVPNFMVQAVERREAALWDRALALIEGAAPLWSVVAANEAAAKAGIALGMTKSQVEQFCGIEIRHRSQTQEKAAHATLLDLGWSVSPRMEDAALDTIVVDLAGLNSLFGSEEDIAKQVRERARDLGLVANVAVASRIDAAVLAARGFSGITVIPAGEEAAWLGRLPIGVLSPSAEILETFERWGIYTCAALAALPVLQLSERLGQEGVRLHELARGESVRSIVLAEPEIHFEEEMELEDSVEELEPLSFLLGRLLDQLCARLVARSMAACAIRVRFDLDPGFDRQNSAPKIYERVLTLPVPMRDSKMLLNLLRLHLQSEPPSAPILKIVLAADAARPRVSQGELYLPSVPDPEKLELTVARLANLVGDSHIGSPELMDTHRPGEFRMRRFVASGNEPEIRRATRRLTEKLEFDAAGVKTPDKKASHMSELPPEDRRTHKPRKLRPPKNGFRIFRPALPASVDLREGCPVRVGFRGMRGEVVAASGPWRSSGDWWREDAWQNDEWDLEMRFLPAPEARVDAALGVQQWERIVNASARQTSQDGLYRIFYDSIRQGWFVRGMYD